MGGSIEFNEYSYSCPQAYKIPDKSQLITMAVCGFSCLPGLTLSALCMWNLLHYQENVLHSSYFNPSMKGLFSSSFMKTIEWSLLRLDSNYEMGNMHSI